MRRGRPINSVPAPTPALNAVFAVEQVYPREADRIALCVKHPHDTTSNHPTTNREEMNMPNWSYTTVTLSGPDAEIERFKQACTFTEPTEGRDGIDFERIIPMPKVDWPECSSSTDDALVVLGRPELRCFGGGSTKTTKTVDDLSPHNIAQARLTISAHEQTGFANSLYWACANWGTKWRPSISTFDGVDERGRQRFDLETAWSPPVPVFEKIVALFPALTLDVYSSDEMGNYFIKGTISASGTELSDDKEAMAKWEAMMMQSASEYEAWRASPEGIAAAAAQAAKPKVPDEDVPF